MVVQSFPMHMHQAIKEIKNYLKLTDLVLFVVDARIPFSSMDFQLLKLINNKPVLLLLNKTLLTDSNRNEFFINFFAKKNIFTLNIDSKYNFNIDKIIFKIKDIFKKNFKKNKYFLKLIVIGVPNVGKSTLINSLTKRKLLRTANKIGTTKKIQWISLNNNIKLLDTPGILLNKITDAKISYSLAICGCIRSDFLNKEKIINHFLPYLRHYYYMIFKKYFNLNDEEIKQEDLLQVLFFKQKNYFINENQKINFIWDKIQKMSQINFDLDLILLS
ncbi:ribosome biogenesis GTPase YlqF [Candidatus Phytoplasma pini]|uniref:Ribosome biogenesis GTPase A n=1 Tax=Candidatus Phytoplasma pini TaxID=267362 RepID=A0A559KJC2_9MOLU|nr:ribosome biogenesis GTPase YlqF [Candidatus Phytoplasma pini]TVY12226.1 ribosome biogenisis GTP-binding protein YlqF/GTPase [Candidatus Phytoplasma pini]